MITEIISFLADIIVAIIGATGYAGVFFLMLIESCGAPMPSEVIMPFAGFLVADGRLNFWIVVFMGAFGNLVGSLIAYWIGWRGGRPVLDKYGKYILISRRDLDLADKWFANYGQAIVFFSRLLPIVRTYISFPAGIAKMNVKKFSFYTFIGAFPWCLLFTWLGVKMGSNWMLIKEKLQDFDIAIAVLIVALVAAYVYRHLRHKRLYE